ncbi:MAG TPA: class II aldolase/adducin family protein [Acidobacteriaceae bacterium]|jgi:HCOMODA/2-hydroxy-3-carboxy-muconic semialdehyde decarboxylase
MQKLRIVTVVLAIVVFFSAGLGKAQQTRTQPAVSLQSELLDDLVFANHILYHQGVVDGFGHISVRDPKNPSHFWMSRSVAPGRVTRADILEFDANGEPVAAGGRIVYLERYIHAAIYRARPDVQAVVHSHSPSVIPFGVTGTVLRPIYHVSGFLGAGAPIFDIRDVAGMTDMLIRSNALGDALAQKLGKGAVVLMRGHGMVVAGDSIPQVVARSINTEGNARLQWEAKQLGEIRFLSPEEAAKAAAVNDSPPIVARSWELWKTAAGKIE